MLRSALSLQLALLLPVAAAAAPETVGDMGTLEAFAQAVDMKQGAWRTRITVTSAEVKPSPDADPADLARIRAQMESHVGKVQERNACLDPKSRDALRLPGIVIDPACSFRRMNAARGRWTLDTVCNDPATREMGEFRGEGRYSRTAVTGRHEGEASMRGVVFDVKVEFESRQVGKCSAPKPLQAAREDG